MNQRHQLSLADKLGEDARTLLYRGRRGADPTPVLVKILKVDYPNKREISRLRHEHDILKTLGQQGVVTVLHLVPFGHGEALVMQDPGGRLLAEHIAAKNLGISTTLRLALSLAHTLDSLHRQRIVHKAVHPRNVLCDLETGYTTLLGFDFAGHPGEAAGDVQQPSGSEIEGEPAYVSPEQTGRMDVPIDERSDLYSFGVTLYEMLAWVLPFTHEDPAELIHSHIARMPVPPHRHNHDIPVVLSNLVMKLLAKAPGDRYQHAGAVAADLETCLNQWESDGKIEPFELGTEDAGSVLRIPHKLYGRETEVETLFAAFDRVGKGRSELLLVTGGAGMGKSVLVQELERAVQRRRGRFIAGKFDQLHRGLPFESFCHAFRDLARRLLAEPPDALARWREKILAAAGSNGQLLIDLIPEISLVIGSQPPTVALGPTETQNRFALVLQDFVRLFCVPSRPLVLFLDDLQWADPASLSLLRILLVDSSSRHLWVIGAYRDGDVGADHPLHTALENLKNEQVPLVEVALQPLALDHVRALLAETLGTTGPHLDSLAKQLFAKTRGNPFFLTQLVTAFGSMGLFCFDRQAGHWTWDSGAIARAPITDNAVDFVVTRLRKLELRTQRLLSLAACLGYHFDLAALAAIADQPLADAAADLAQALREELVLQYSDSRSVPASEPPPRATGRPAADTHFAYRFLHDRVQHAAYALIDADSRTDVHLRIGRRLQDKLTDDSGAESLFEAVHHLNAGAARVDDPEERRQLARLNLKAGRTAKASTAYAAASGFLDAGILLLEGAGEGETDELGFSIHREHAECELLSGHFEKAGTEIDRLLSTRASTQERAELLGLRLQLALSQLRPAEGLAAGRAALSLLGVDLPDKPEVYDEAFRSQVAAIDEILAGKPLESLIDTPLVTDPGHESLLGLLGALGAHAYQGEPTFAPVVMAKHVHLSLARGQSTASIWGYAFYGFILAGLGQYPLAIRLVRLAALLTEKHHAAHVECNVYMQRGTYSAFGEPMRLSLDYLARSQRVGLETGDHFFASLSFLYYPLTQFRLGEPLDAVRAEVDRSSIVVQRTKIVMTTVWLVALRQVTDRLQGLHEGRALLHGQPQDEAEWAARLDAEPWGGISCFYHLYRLQFLLLHEDHAGAFAEIAPIEQRVGYLLNLHWTTDLPFYASLTLVALPAAETTEEQAQRRESLERYRHKLAALAELCPANELHRKTLVDAEAARVSGDERLAMSLYEEAVTLAREHGFPHHEALANELCAKFHLANGRARVARVYLIEARYGYEQWGATTKVKQLEEKYPELLLSDRPAKELRSAPSTAPAEHLDVTAIMQAMQTVAGEIVLDRLLDRFMKIIIANAGAQKGLLVLKRQDALTIEASVAVDPDTVTVGQSEPLEGSSLLPAAVVRYVERTGESLALHSPGTDPRFAGDPYIAAQDPKSVLCLALMHRGHFAGALYLENRIVPHAFPAGRIQFLELLASQAAIAIENALLYVHLETQVGARTDELRAANERLHATNERLQIELAERERLQQTQARMQEQIIRAQNTRLLELSTPIIPITDQIMVMPIVGTIDEARAQQMLDNSLQGVHDSQPKVVIIDITGVRFVDPDVAGTLMRIAGALRLLGTQTVITGIRAAVAQTLIALGVNLQSIETRANLKMGIAYALNRTGEAPPNAIVPPKRTPP